jgi:putative transposase
MFLTSTIKFSNKNLHRPPPRLQISACTPLSTIALAISMDGRGCWRDNVFVERLWKSIKYEEVYLRAYETVSAARSGIARYIDFYNSRRPHSSLDAMTPDAFYFKHLPFMQRAA